MCPFTVLCSPVDFPYQAKSDIHEDAVHPPSVMLLPLAIGSAVHTVALANDLALDYALVVDDDDCAWEKSRSCVSWDNFFVLDLLFPIS